MTRENLTECVSLRYLYPSVRCVRFVRYGFCVVTSHTTRSRFVTFASLGPTPEVAQRDSLFSHRCLSRSTVI